MGDVAYMNRHEWAHDLQMELHSERVHAWLGGRPHFIVVADRSRIGDTGSVVGEAVRFICPAQGRRGFLEYTGLRGLAARPNTALVFVHPVTDEEQSVTREFLEEEEAPDAFVMVWGSQDLIRLWLESRRATNLLGRGDPAMPDPVARKAAEAIVHEEYNGLTTGRGKDTAIQALRALRTAGYTLDADYWARAVLSVGGSFESARTVARFATEVGAGRRHRVKERFKPEIVAIWEETASDGTLALDPS